MYDEEMLVDNFEDEVIRKPDIVKKQRLMDTQYDYFDFQAKKNALAKSVPVRWACFIQYISVLFYIFILLTRLKNKFMNIFSHCNSFFNPLASLPYDS